MSERTEQLSQMLKESKKQDKQENKSVSIYKAYTERKDLRKDVWNTIANNEHHYMTEAGDFDRFKIETLLGEKLAKSGYMPTEQDYKIVCAESVKTIDANSDFTVELDCSIPPSQWIRELRDRAFFIPAKDIPSFAQWAFEAAKDIQNTCRTGKVAKFENGRKRLHLIINSNKKNTGKSWFINSIIDGARKLGIASDKDVSLPIGGFGNTKAESKNIILSYSEPDEKKMNVDMATVKCVGRREPYRYEAKGVMATTLQSRAITIGSTNGQNYAPDNTTHLVVGTIPYSWSQFPAEIRDTVRKLGATYDHFFQLDSNDSNDSINSITNQLCKLNFMNNDPVEDDAESLESENLRRKQIKWIVDQPGAIDVVRAIADNKFAIISEDKGISPAYLTSLAPTVFNNDAAIGEMERFLEECVSNKLLKRKAYTNNGRKRPKDETWYYQYNIKDSVLMDITIDDFTPGEFSDNDDMLSDAQKVWEEVFAIFDAMPPKDPSRKSTQADEDIDALLSQIDGGNDIVAMKKDRAVYDYIDEPTSSYADQYQSLPTNRSDDEFETINPIKSGMTRSDANVASMRNFLFEIDGEAETDEERVALINKQLAMVKPLVDSHIVNRIVYSGGKSIHARITVANEITDKDEYKLVWHHLNNKYFNGLADNKCSNPSRFTRRIGGIRKENGRKQSGAKTGNWVIDIGDMLTEWEIMDAKNDAKRRFIREMERDVGSSCNRQATIRATVDGWKDSPTKESIIACLDGVGSYDEDLFRALNAIKWMGFSYDEVCDEIDFGKWNIRREFYEKLEVE